MLSNERFTVKAEEGSLSHVTNEYWTDVHIRNRHGMGVGDINICVSRDSA